MSNFMATHFRKPILFFCFIFLQNILIFGQEFNSIAEANKKPEEVKILDLSDNKLIELSSQIANYQNLEEIDLGSNPNLNLENAFNVLKSNKK